MLKDLIEMVDNKRGVSEGKKGNSERIAWKVRKKKNY